MHTLSEFEVLASETGIALPGLLRSLLSTGKTTYGPDWASTWRQRALQGTAPFISWYDFEWLEAAAARREIKEWLNPEVQNGKVFLPFAQSGAGDTYCLMPINKHSTGVALIWHDDDTSQIGYRSFDDFVAVQFLEAFTNLNHHADDFTHEEILQCVKSDISCVTGLMDIQIRDYLQSFHRQPLMPREFRYGPKSRPQNVLSLISQEQLDIELAKFPAPDLAPFTIVAPWEVNGPLEEAAIHVSIPEPVADWRSYASDPKQKLLAIQTFRHEFGVSLAEAKTAVDLYIESTNSNT